MNELFRQGNCVLSEDFAECFAWSWIAPELFTMARPVRAEWFLLHFPDTRWSRAPKLGTAMVCRLPAQ